MKGGSAAHIEVKQLSRDDAGRWDSFVDNCSAATFFHRAAWQRVVEKSFGHECHFLLAEVNGEVCGVLPLVHIKSRLFSNALVSNAFCVYGGPVATTDEAHRALDRTAQALAEQLGVDYLEYRLREPSSRNWPAKRELYATFRKEMSTEADSNLQAIPRKQRAMVRKGIKAGLRSEVDRDIDRFFPIYAQSVRDQGTPVFPKRYFRALKEVFGENCEVLTVLHGERPVSSVLSFFFRDEVLPYYGGGLPDARRLAAFDFMYWEVMRRACEKGCRIFDFGRSKRGTGAFDFKRHWGFEAQPLSYEYLLVGAKQIPQIDPFNPKYRLAIEAWKHLPLGVANLISPMISRNLG
jgi:FemAB-related protein (PEP-CTERM system-associated)